MKIHCEHCLKDRNIIGKWFKDHVKRCLDQQEFYRKKQERADLTKEYSYTCIKCNNIFTKFHYPKNIPQFCSIKCANTRIHSDETKQKIKDGVLKTCYNKLNGSDKRKHPKLICECGEPKAFQAKRCKPCSLNFKRLASNRPAKEHYRTACRFTFALNKYPNEFDFDLIRKHGWFQATNRPRPNLAGVSRDHIISVMYGFNNQIDPKLLAHPANCQLLIHTENIRKGSNLVITVEELKEKIKLWDEKYSKI